MNNPTGESKIGGVSIRSWNATVIIVVGTVAVCYLAIKSEDAGNVMILVSGAVSFLFGKAAGAQQPKPE
jgi:hypothetical protein